MDFKAARLAMVESQIRPNGVRDPRILNAFATLERERFVPESQKALAYMDGPVPALLAENGAASRFLLPPMTLARLLQYADPRSGDRALDVGGATGYSTGVLAKLCKSVDALETQQSITDRMQHCLSEAGINGVSIHLGPLEKGVDKSKPFEIVLVNGGVAEEPRQLFDQLAEGGRLVAILRAGWLGQAFLYEKSGGTVSGRPIFDAGADILPGFEAKPQFVF